MYAKISRIIKVPKPIKFNIEIPYCAKKSVNNGNPFLINCSSPKMLPVMKALSPIAINFLLIVNHNFDSFCEGFLFSIQNNISARIKMNIPMIKNAKLFDEISIR